MSSIEMARAFWLGLQRARAFIAARDWTNADACVYALRQLVMLPEGQWLSQHAMREAAHLAKQIEDRQ